MNEVLIAMVVNSTAHAAIYCTHGALHVISAGRIHTARHPTIKGLAISLGMPKVPHPPIEDTASTVIHLTAYHQSYNK